MKTTPQPSTLYPHPSFPRCLGETPRALCAFTTFFSLGRTRSLQAVAHLLDESIDAVKRWSSRFHWTERILAFEAGLLQNQAQAQAGSRQQQAADWTRRNTESLEQQWDATRKLLAAAQCYLETLDQQQFANMSLSQATRAIQAAAHVSRAVLQEGTLTPRLTSRAPVPPPAAHVQAGSN